MNSKDIKNIFEKTYKTKNFMTPDIVKYRINKGYIAEFSKGKGIGGRDIFGCTILTVSGDKTELNECFDTLEDAENYFKNL